VRPHLGIAITSLTFSSRNLFMFAGRRTRAVSHPEPLPPMATTSSKVETLPASAAIIEHSTATLNPWDILLYAYAMTSGMLVPPNLLLNDLESPLNAWVATTTSTPMDSSSDLAFSEMLAWSGFLYPAW